MNPGLRLDTPHEIVDSLMIQITDVKKYPSSFAPKNISQHIPFVLQMIHMQVDSLVVPFCLLCFIDMFPLLAYIIIYSDMMVKKAIVYPLVL